MDLRIFEGGSYSLESLEIMAKNKRSKSKTRSRKPKAGQIPGSLVFLGEQRASNTVIRHMSYNSDVFREELDVKESPDHLSTAGIDWVDVVGVHDAEMIRKVGDHFGIHPLVQEDIMNTGQRPKTEVHDDYIFIVVKMINVLPGEIEVNVEQVSLVVGNGWLLTFQEDEEDVFEVVRERIRNDKGRIRKMGADYLAYALLDAIVDTYFLILEEFGDKIEVLEAELIDGKSEGRIHQVQSMKREVISLRKTIWPLREVINNFAKTESKFVSPELKPYLHDIYDHSIQVIETIESYRDMIGGVQDLYLSVVNNKMNEVMKVLALISTIFLPMTLVAGIYGMNFEGMPELKTTWGYPVAMALMGVIGVSMYVLFKLRKWI